MSLVATARSAIIRLSGVEYDVTYELVGDCTFEAAQTSGPPERCHEGWSTSDVDKVNIGEVFVEGIAVEIADKCRTDLVRELNKLPLDDYLMEAYMAQLAEGPDDDYEPGD